MAKNQGFDRASKSDSEPVDRAHQRMPSAKASIFISVEQDGRAGHLLVREFRLDLGNQPDSGRKPSCSVRTTTNIERVVLALLLWKLDGVWRFAKADACWKGLQELLRCYENPHRRPPDWCEKVFGKASLRVVFPRQGPNNKDEGRFITIDTARFPREAVTIALAQYPEGASSSTLETLKKWLKKKHLGSSTSNGGQDSDCDNDIWNRVFAEHLASELQVPGFKGRDKVLLGKAIWLDQLLILKRVFEQRIVAAIHHLEECVQGIDPTGAHRGTFEASGPAGWAGPSGWLSRIDEVWRIIDANLSLPAEKAGHDLRRLRAYLGSVRRVVDQWLVAQEQNRDGSACMKDAHSWLAEIRAILGTSGDELATFGTALNERIGQCREILKQLAASPHNSE
jgi:hypothetical protein